MGSECGGGQEEDAEVSTWATLPTQHQVSLRVSPWSGQKGLGLELDIL